MPAEPVSPVTVFITHESEHVSLATAVVDLLEESITGAEGRIGCSALPGYPSDLSQVLGYRRDLSSPASPRALIIGLRPAGAFRVTEDLRAAQKADVQIILLADIGAGQRRSDQFAGATRLTMDVAGLTALVEDVAYSLRVRPRFSQGAREALSAVVEAATMLGSARSPLRRGDSSQSASDGTPLRPLPPVTLDSTEVQPASELAARHAERRFAALAGEGTGEYGGSDLSPDLQTREVARPPAQPSQHMAVDARPGHAPRTPGAPPPLPGGGSGSAPTQSQAVEKAPVTAVQCVQAGVDLCDCLFAELDAPTRALQLQAHFAPFFAGLGGDFERLARFAADDEDWQAAVDDRIEALPPERAWIGQWYVAGYQLAILCNLASLPPGAAPEDVTSESWGDFCSAAEAVGLDGAVLSELRGILRFPHGNADDPHARAACLGKLRALAEQNDDARDMKRQERARTAG